MKLKISTISFRKVYLFLVPIFASSFIFIASMIFKQKNLSMLCIFNIATLSPFILFYYKSMTIKKFCNEFPIALLDYYAMQYLFDFFKFISPYFILLLVFLYIVIINILKLPTNFINLGFAVNFAILTKPLLESIYIIYGDFRGKYLLSISFVILGRIVITSLTPSNFCFGRLYCFFFISFFDLIFNSTANKANFKFIKEVFKSENTFVLYLLLYATLFYFLTLFFALHSDPYTIDSYISHGACCLITGIVSLIFPSLTEDYSFTEIFILNKMVLHSIWAILQIFAISFISKYEKKEILKRMQNGEFNVTNDSDGNQSLSNGLESVEEGSPSIEELPEQ